MISDLNEQLEMIGASGDKYVFRMYGFGNFDELQDFFEEVVNPGLYVFTRRYKPTTLSTCIHEPVYLGETGNFKNRNLATHHKRKEIEETGVHSFGINLTDGINEDSRKGMEADLLSAYDLPLNIVDN